jgi:1,2-dihydroxy-3-keto-5-methylthiopentene dioxygenase
MLGVQAMSRLTVTPDKTPGQPTLRTEDPVVIAEALRAIGVRFERWELPVEVAPDAPAEAILDVCRPYLDTLMGQTGAGTADVIKLSPGSDAYPAMRAKFLDEHTHTEDEVRFFVQGAGNFILHVDGRVFDVHCTRHDLISVPAYVKHWFDAGENPSFTVLRVFTDTTGWTPHYTGDKISALFPAS